MELGHTVEGDMTAVEKMTERHLRLSEGGR